MQARLQQKFHYKILESLKNVKKRNTDMAESDI